jgi:vitamin B12 transporter
MLRTFCLFALLSLSFYAKASASDEGSEIRVEAQRINEDQAPASPSTSVLTRADLEASHAPTVGDLLREIPGIEITRQGGVGQTMLISIRGARSEDTLVLVDGVDANDSMSPSRGFDFANLSADNIDRIEILRGPETVKYGPDALGGVINIITKEGRGALSGGYFLEAGSYDTMQTKLGASGGTSNIGYSFGAGALQTHGFPAADSHEAGNIYNAGAQLANLSSRLDWHYAPGGNLEWVTRYFENYADLAQRGGPYGSDPNDTSQFHQFLTAVTARDHFFSGRLSSSLGFSYSEVDRSDQNLADPISSVDSKDHFISEDNKIESNHEYAVDDDQSLRLGLSAEFQSGSSYSVYDGAVTAFPRQIDSIYGTSVLYKNEGKTYFGDAGVRLDDDLRFGNSPNYQATFGRHFVGTQTTLRAKYATAFKAPSLYQLYSSYGSPGLFPENAEAGEISVEQKIANPASLTATLFANRYRNLIDFNEATQKYQNISAAKTSGLETQAKIDIDPNLSANVVYTYLSSTDESTGLELLRRPQNSWSAGLHYLLDRWDLSLIYRYFGERADVDPVSFNRVTLPGYDVIDISGSYRMTKHLKITARIENLFDRVYEEVDGYGTPARSAYLGLQGDI